MEFQMKLKRFLKQETVLSRIIDTSFSIVDVEQNASFLQR